jgi:dTDP-4-amino-4,6-dideoxygalactose transaminase
LHAAIGIEQLRRLEDFTRRRRANAAFLNARIDHASIEAPGQVIEACACCATPAAGHVWHQYTIRVRDGRRDEFVQRLMEAGVGTGVFYPVPVHRQVHIVERGLGGASLPQAERAAREVLSLPVHPALSESDLHRIVAAVNAL